MADLIDRKQAIDAMLNDKVEITEEIKAIGSTELFKTLNMTCDRHAKMLRELPSAEPQIIRCKKCEKERWCKFTQYQGENGYCSLAERRIDEEVQDNS